MKRIWYDFDWDDANRRKCQKHGVSVSEIEFLFTNNPQTIYDHKHSNVETRYFVVGKNKKDRYVFVSFTYRIKNDIRSIRPFSARYMHKKEVNNYKRYEDKK